ncbi:MAG: hypothetical protein WC435_03400 [Candidatus Paceibacterota bacterium]
MLILAVMNDIGSCKTIFPVGLYLRKIGHKVKFLASGNSLGILSEEDEKKIKKGDVKAVVTGMSTDPFEYSVASTWRDKCPIIAIPDQWSTPFFSGGWKNRECYPDVVCVNDEIGRGAVRSWGFNGFIVETGWPALDVYADREKWKAKNQEMREKLYLALKLSLKTKLIFFIGQGSRENAEALQELLETTAKIGLSVKVIAMEHPNMRRHEPEGTKFWDRVVGVEEEKGQSLLLKSSGFSSLEVLMAADVVVSDFSSMLTEAAILGKSVISVFYPSKRICEIFKKWDWAQNTFPLEALGCCFKAENRDQLQEFLERALISGFEFSERAKKVFRLDGKNSARVAKIVENLAECHL